MRTRLFAAGCCLTGFLAGILAGCGDSAAPTATETAAAPPPIVQNSLPAPETIENDVAKRKQVTVDRCASTNGGWSAAGSAANPGTAPANYTIVVFFTTESATVLDYAETTVTVEPGATAEWKATKEFAAPEKTLCVLRGVSD